MTENGLMWLHHVQGLLVSLRLLLHVLLLRKNTQYKVLQFLITCSIINKYEGSFTKKNRTYTSMAFWWLRSYFGASVVIDNKIYKEWSVRWVIILVLSPKTEQLIQYIAIQIRDQNEYIVNRSFLIYLVNYYHRCPKIWSYWQKKPEVYMLWFIGNRSFMTNNHC